MSTGRTFVVTGATGALGRAVTARLLARGDRVAVPRDAARFEALRSSLSESGRGGERQALKKLIQYSLPTRRRMSVDASGAKLS